MHLAGRGKTPEPCENPTPNISDVQPVKVWNVKSGNNVIDLLRKAQRKESKTIFLPDTTIPKGLV